MSRPTPIHKKIADELRRRIVAREYSNDEIPPELRLMEEFRVSRHTVRTALLQLVNDGIIERRPGSGTRVIRASRSGFWALGSLDDLAGGDFVVGESLTFSARKEPVRSFPNIAEMFHVKPSGNIFHIVRILTSGGLPYAVSHLFCLPKMVKNIPEHEISKQNLVDLLQTYNGSRSSRARQMATAALASLDAARQLGIDEGSPVLIMHRTFFSSDGQVLVHSEVTCRPDRYQQVVNFLRE